MVLVLSRKSMTRPKKNKKKLVVRAVHNTKENQASIQDDSHSCLRAHSLLHPSESVKSKLVTINSKPIESLFAKEFVKAVDNCPSFTTCRAVPTLLVNCFPTSPES